MKTDVAFEAAGIRLPAPRQRRAYGLSLKPVPLSDFEARFSTPLQENQTVICIIWGDIPLALKMLQEKRSN